MQDLTLSPAPRTQWLGVILGCLASSIVYWKYALIGSVILLILYCLCRPLKWVRLQKILIYIYGGFSIGLGIAIMIYYHMAGQPVPMIIAPLLAWLVLRVIFCSLETRYALYLLPDYDDHNEEKRAQQFDSSIPRGESAWSGETEGKASEINTEGYYMSWKFYLTGEIAMGGPTYGDVIFTNKCALSYVGPSVALSNHGRYAALTLPSRQQWGLLLVDLENKKVYNANDSYNLWEIDHMDEEYIYGRYSPLDSDTALRVSIKDLIEDSECQNMREDDGWWFINDTDHTPLPQYAAVSFLSDNKQHKALFVPNLEPFRSNPFLRYSPPLYQLLIDDVLQPDYQTQQAEAFWVDGKTAQEQARFLILGSTILDFMPNADLKFYTASPTKHGLNWQHCVPYFYFDCYSGSHNGIAQFKFIKVPRSYDWDEAITTNRGYFHPTDEEVTYWNLGQQEQSESRQHTQQCISIEVDLSLLLTHSIHHMPLLLTSPAHCSIKLMSESKTTQDEHQSYGCYQTVLPWGEKIEHLTAEFQWSPCGRYLALLKWQEAPAIANQIIIIDFKQQKIQTVAGSYALASFIWLDEHKLELTHKIDSEQYEHIILFGADFNQVVAQPPS